MWLLFIPILIVLVVMLMLGSLFAGVFWLLGNFWPWLLIGIGAWMFWHQDGRHYRRRQARAAWVARGAPVRSERSEQRPSSKSKKEAAKLKPSELPIDMQVKVEQIRRKVDVMLGYADRFPPFSQDLYLVRQTATDYLPRTVNAFLSMPADAVDTPMASYGGKTARQELTAQLELLDKKLDDIAQDLRRQDADRLMANRRFLEQRFGNRDGLASADAAAAAPAQEAPAEVSTA
ncbi:MAG TPA: hypothetical protein VGJ60_12090 [Chloroflexota bacterium]|jgi:hypothetical protein